MRLKQFLKLNFKNTNAMKSQKEFNIKATSMSNTKQNFAIQEENIMGDVKYLFNIICLGMCTSRNRN